MPRTRHILSVYVYDTLNNRYGFSISVQPEIDCTTFHSFFSWNVWKKFFFKIFKSWQVCDWLAKWIIMLGFMDLRWPRVFRRSSVGLVWSYFVFICNSKPTLSGVEAGSCWAHVTSWHFILEQILYFLITLYKTKLECGHQQTREFKIS